MKKLLIACYILLGFTGMVSAQEVAKKTANQTTTKAKPAAPAAPAKAGPVKKDGTLDKRFSANKSSTPALAAGPVKKDGTPDKRYKANKKN